MKYRRAAALAGAVSLALWVGWLIGMFVATAPPVFGTNENKSPEENYQKGVELLYEEQSQNKGKESPASHTVKGAAQALPAPPALPFADGISIQFPLANGAILPRQVDGTYITLQFDSTDLSLLSPISELDQLFSCGVNDQVDAPTGPVGTASQSQGEAVSGADNNGSVAYAGASDSSVSVSQSTTGATANYTIGPGVVSVFFADFNGDGNPDLAVGYTGSTTPGGIAILLNNGDGTFANPVTYGTLAGNFAVFDLNHDGALDIVALSGATVTVFLGKGDGTFSAQAPYTVGGSGQAIAIADFNGDGVPDIAAGSGILLGNGNGTFRMGHSLPASSSFTNNDVWAFAAGDLNGDGKMDLVYADFEQQFVVPLFGNGDGTFTQGQAYAVSQMPDSLVLADFNHDGLLDIINGSGDQRNFGGADQSGNTDILLNNGDGTFQGAPVYLPPPNSGLGGFLLGEEMGTVAGAGAAAAKFGGAAPGVLVSTGNGDAVLLFRGDGKGGFQASQSFTLPSGQPGAIASADFNGDGLPDAAVIEAGTGNVAILLGTASGFGTPAVVSSGGLFPTAIVSADFDGDGKADLAVLSESAYSSTGSSPGTLAFLKGKGNGTFGAPVTIPAGFTPLYVSAVDLNGDGKLDLVFSDEGAANGTGGGVYMALNMGGGAFQAPVQVFSGGDSAFALADVNGDGKLDLVASDGAMVSWLAGNGNGTFQTPIAITTSDAPVSSIVIQDFAGDGNQDIVLAHNGSETSYLAGLGNGMFAAEEFLTGPNSPTLLLTTDLNGDGKPDLIVVGTTMAVLINDSPPTNITIQTNPPGLQFDVDSCGEQTAPQTLGFAPDPYIIGVGTPQAAIAAGTQYAFTGWSDGGAGEHMITVGTSAATYTASFTTQYELTISASPAAGGTVTPVTGTFYNSGTVVPVTATAASGYTFTGWTGSVASSSSSSTTVTMSAPETLTANFSSSAGSGHPAFFSGEDSLGGGVYYLQFPDNNLFGYYNYPASTVIYHYDMGFEAFVPSTSGQIYFYDFTSGHWWYTSSSLFPYLYDFTLNTFIYYFPDTKNAGHYTTGPRYFSNLTTGKIFTL